MWITGRVLRILGGTMDRLIKPSLIYDEQTHEVLALEGDVGRCSRLIYSCLGKRHYSCAYLAI